jgi:hypothetical protein
MLSHRWKEKDFQGPLLIISCCHIDEQRRTSKALWSLYHVVTSMNRGGPPKPFARYIMLSHRWIEEDLQSPLFIISCCHIVPHYITLSHRSSFYHVVTLFLTLSHCHIVPHSIMLSHRSSLYLVVTLMKRGRPPKPFAHYIILSHWWKKLSACCCKYPNISIVKGWNHPQGVQSQCDNLCLNCNYHIHSLKKTIYKTKYVWIESIIITSTKVWVPYIISIIFICSCDD